MKKLIFILTILFTFTTLFAKQRVLVYPDSLNINEYQWFVDSLNTTGLFNAQLLRTSPVGKNYGYWKVITLQIIHKDTSLFVGTIGYYKGIIIGTDKLSLTYGCMSFIDSIKNSPDFYSYKKINGYDVYYCKPLWHTDLIKNRAVLLTGNFYEHPDTIRLRFLRCVNARATEVIIQNWEEESSFSQRNNRATLDKLHNIMDLSDKWGLKIRLGARDLSKSYSGFNTFYTPERGSISIESDYIPMKVHHGTVDIRLSSISKEIKAGQDSTNRCWIPISFNEEEQYRLYDCFFNISAKDTFSTEFRWFRQKTIENPLADKGVVVSQNILETPVDTLRHLYTYHYVISSLEYKDWYIYFIIRKGACQISSILIQERIPNYRQHEMLSDKMDVFYLNGKPEMGYKYIGLNTSSYLTVRNCRYDSESYKQFCIHMIDSIYNEYKNHESFTGFWLDTDEIGCAGWSNPDKSVGELYGTLLNNIISYNDLILHKSTAFYADMFTPSQNAKQYQRGCSPLNGGFLNSQQYIPKNPNCIPVVWGATDSLSCSRYYKDWLERPFYVGITLDLIDRQTIAWQSYFNQINGVYFFDWDNYVYQQEWLNKIKKWY